METLATIIAFEEVDSDADFILYSPWDGLISEHCTLGEARVAYLQSAQCKELGQQLPGIYERQDNGWAPLCALSYS